jgi:signal transduction histidine kinase
VGQIDSSIKLWRAILPTLVMASVFFGLLYAANYFRVPRHIDPITKIQAQPSSAPKSWAVWPEHNPSAWLPFTLPTRICKVRCTTPYTAWRYSFEWSPQQMDDPAVYFPYAETNVAFYLNGSLIHLRGSMNTPPSAYRFEPRLIRLPIGLMREGENELSWQLVIEHRGLGGVEPFYLANFRELEAPHKIMRILTKDLILGAHWLQWGAFIFAIGLYLRGTKETILLWYLLAAPCWLFLSAWYIYPNMPGPVNLRFSVFFTAMIGLIAFSSLFVLSMLKPPPNWLKRASIGYFFFVAALAFTVYFWPGLDNPTPYSIINRVIRYSSLIVLPFVLILLFQYLNQHRAQILARWIFAAAMFSGLAGMNDVFTGSLGQMNYTLAPLAGFGISVAFLLEMGRRVMVNQAAMARYNEELEATVNAKETELRGNYDRLREADKERALSQERNRIMRDMHDGVGGQLAALLHLANDETVGRGEIIEAVRIGLADMRLVLDSLNQSDGDLLMALGTFRERSSALLRHSGIQLNWQQQLSLESNAVGAPFGPEAVLNVFRILQEALTNAVRHANARNITITINENESALVISVHDDGDGFDASAGDKRGHYGLSGMRQRAAKLSGKIKLESTPGNGTTISLQIPKTGDSTA